jgi:hypothetical protein
MHSIKEKPVVVNGQIVIRPIMVVALTYDHRLLDGREAVTFLGEASVLRRKGRADHHLQSRSATTSRTLARCSSHEQSPFLFSSYSSISNTDRTESFCARAMPRLS